MRRSAWTRPRTRRCSRTVRCRLEVRGRACRRWSNAYSSVLLRQHESEDASDLGLALLVLDNGVLIQVDLPEDQAVADLKTKVMLAVGIIVGREAIEGLNGA